ncbi:hypothetical protein BESB_038040 [Besnoitia besnoiti]|uniref:Uncharacterized protein n=1 Tax=Besnoitia besnoiti TaxID=94643 RepID=A0A2A9MMK8_BESBE|nr:hypothetical protein BESB_038040 [Besnoitia besnoiti]PFH37346.1 hypothetical protein BESB_038040 [Besnoitia besnoiti]
MAPPLVSSLLPESSPRHEAEEAAAAREVTGSEVCGFAAGSEASCPVYGAHCGAPSPGEGEEVNRLAALIRSVESGRPSAYRRAVRGLAAKLRLYEATRRGCRCTRAPTTGASKGPFSRASVSPERRDFEGESDAQGGARREAQGAGERGDVCPATGASCENDADAANAALHRHAGRVRAGDAGGSGEGPRGDRQPPPRRDAVSGCDSPVCASRTWLHHALAAALARLVQRGVETNGLAATAATAEVARDDEVALGAREEEENQDALLQGLQLVKALCEMDSQYLPAFHGLGMVAHLNRLLSRLLEASRRSQASRVNDVETLCSPPLFRTPHPALAPTVTEVLQTLLTLSPARDPARALVSPSLLLCTAPSGAIGANRMWAQGAANVQAYPTPTGGCAGASGAGGASSAVSDASAFAEAPRLAAAAFPASRAPAHRDSHPPLPSDGAPPPAASQGPSPCALPSTGSSAAPSRAGLAEARGLGARAEWGAARPDEFLAGNGSRSAERGGDAGTAGQVSLCVAARPAPRSVVPAIVHDPRILACRPEDSRRTSGSSTPRGETRDSSPRAPRRALRALSSPSAAATPSSAASSCPVSPLFLKVPDSSFTLCAVPAPASPATYGERGDRALEQEGGALPASESRGYLRLEQPSAGVSPRTSALPASAEPSASPLSPRRARAASPAAARGAVLGAEGGLGRRGEATAGLDAAADSLRKPRGVGGRRACDERGERGRAARDWRGSQTRCAGEEASETRGVHASDVELLQSLCEAFSAPSLPSADAIRLATCLPVDVLPDLHPVARLAVSRSLWRQHERLAASPWSPSSFSSSPASSLFSFRALAPSQLKRRKQALALAPPACLLQALGQALANAGDALEETGGGGVGFASVSLFRQASGEGPQTSWLHLGSVRRRNGHEKECIPSLLRAANATLENLREVLSVASCASPRGGGLPLAGQPVVPFSAASVSPRTSASSPLRCGCCADFPCRALLASLVTRAFASALTEPEALPQIRRLLALCLQVHRLFLKRLPAEEPRPSSRLAAGDAAPAEASESPAEERPSLFAAEEAAHVGALLRRAAERYFPQERDRFAPVAEAATATTVSRRKIAGEMKLLLERVPAVGGSGEGPEDPTRVARGRTETFGDSGDEEGTLQVSTASALTPEQDTFLDIFWLALASIPAPLRLTWLAESRLLPHLLFFLLRSNVLFARSRLVPLLLQPLFTACCARSARLDAESRGDGLREAFPSSPASAAEALCAAGCQAPAGDTKCAFSSGKAFFHASLMIDALLALWLQLGGGGPPAWTCAPQLARAEAPRREEDSQQPDGGRPAHAETLDKAFIGGRLPQESVDAPRASFSEAFAEAVVACFQARHQSFENVRALLPFISSCTFTSWRDSENASGGQRAARVPSPKRAPAACGASPPPGVSQDTAPAAAGAALFPLYLFLLGNPRGPRRPQSPHADASGFGAEEEEEEDAEGRRDAADAHERLRVLLHALVNAVFHSALQALARLRGTCAAPSLPVSVSLLALLALLTCPNSRVAAVFFSRVSEMLLDFPPFSPSGARRLSPLANATSPAADGPSPRPSSPAAPSFVSSPSAFAPALASLLLSPDFIYELCVSGPPAARAFLKSRVVPFLLRVGGFFGSHDDISTRSAFCSEALCALDFVDLWDPVLLPPLLALPEDACASSPSSSRPPRWPGSAEGGASVAVLARFSAAQLLRRLFSVQAAVRRDAGEALRLQAQGLASAAAALAASSPFFAFSPSCSPPARRAAAALAGAAAARERGRGGEAERKGRQRNGPRDARAPRAASRGEVGEPADPLGTAAAHWRTQGREEMQRLVVRDLVWRQAEIDVLVRALANPKLDAQTKLQSLQALSVYLASCPSEGARFLASPDFFTGVGAGETSGAAASAAAARDASPGPNERDGARLAGTLQGLRGASSLATTRAALRRLSLGSRAPDAAGAQATSVISSVQLLPSLLSMFFALCVEAVSAVGGTSSIVLELLAEALRLFGVFLLVLPTRGRVSLQLHAHLESELVASGILGALALSPAAAASAAVCFHSMQLAGLLLFSPFHTFLFASRLSPLEPGLAPLLAEPPASRLRGAAAPLEPRPATPGEARVSSWAFPGASARLAARAPPARAATAQGEGRALRLLVPCWVTKTYLFPLPLKQVQLRSASLCFWDARPQNVAFELAADAWAHVGSLLASGALAPAPHVSRELPEETHGRGEIQGGGESRERVDDACDAAAWGVVRAGDGSSGRDGSKDVCSPRRQSRREAFPIFFVDLVAQALAGCAPREGDRETPGGCADERDDGMSPADSALAPWAMPALLMSLAETQGLALSRSRQVALAREAPFLSLRLPDSVRELSALAEGDGGDSFVSAASAAAAGALPSGSSWRATPLPVVGLARSNLLLTPRVAQLLLEPDSRYFSLLLQLVRQPPPLRTARSLLRGLSAEEAERSDDDGFARVWRNEAEEEIAGVSHPADVPFLEAVKAADLLLRVLSEEALAAGGATCCKGDRARRLALERGGKGTSTERDAARRRLKSERLANWSTGSAPWDGENLPPSLRLALASLADAAAQRILPFVADQASQLAEVLEEKDRRAAALASPLADRERTDRDARLNGASESPLPGDGNLQGEACAPASQPPSWSSPETCRRASAASCVRELDLLLACIEFLLRLLPLVMRQSVQWCDVGLLPAAADGHLSGPLGSCFCCCVRTVDVPRLFADLFRISGDLSTLRRRAFDLAECLLLPLKARQPSEILGSAHATQRARKRQAETRGRAARDAREDSGDSGLGGQWEPQSREYLERELLFHLQTAETSERASDLEETLAGAPLSASPSARFSASLRVVSLQGKRPVSQALRLATAVILPLPRGEGRPGALVASRRAALSAWAHAASYWMADSAPEVREAAWRLLADLCSFTSLAQDEDEAPSATSILASKGASPRSESLATSQASSARLASLPPDAWQSLLVASAEAVQRVVGECPQDPAANPPRVPSGATVFVEPEETAGLEPKAVAGAADEACTRGTALPAGFCALCPESLAESVAAALFLSTAVELLGSYFEFEKQHAARTSVSAETFSTTGKHRSFTEEDGAGGRHALGLIHPPAVTESDQEMRGRGEREPLEPEEEADVVALEACLNAVHSWLCSPRFLCGVLPLFLPLDGGISYALSPSPRALFPRPAEAKLAGIRLFRLALSLSPAPVVSLLAREPTDPRLWLRSPSTDAFTRGEGSRPAASLEGAAGLERRRWGLWEALVAAVRPDPGDMSDQEAAEGALRNAGSGSLKGHEACAAGSRSVAAGLEALESILEAGAKDRDSFQLICAESPLLLHARMLVEGVLRRGFSILTDHGNGACCCVAVERHERARRNGISCGATGRHRARPSAGGRPASSAYPLSRILHASAPGRCMLAARRARETTELLAQVGFLVELLLRLFRLLHPQALDSLPPAAAAVFERRCADRVPVPRPAVPLEPWAVGGRQGPVSRREAAGVAQEVAWRELWSADALWLFILYCIQVGTVAGESRDDVSTRKSAL